MDLKGTLSCPGDFLVMEKKEHLLFVDSQIVSPCQEHLSLMEISLMLVK